MSLRFFGTDGIRGAYGSESMNDEIAFRAGAAAVKVARRLDPESETIAIVVGRDTRSSGVALRDAFAKGVSAEGGVLWDLGIVPTPCVAFAAKLSEAQLGCVFTASHNPASDNGIKFFQGDGCKPSESLEQELDSEIGRTEVDDTEVTPKIAEANEWRIRYADEIVSKFGEGNLGGMAVALDCANGAMSQLAGEVFQRLGAKVEIVANAPDGTNINAGVGSEHPESLQSLFAKSSFDIGFAFDGDGDRVIVFDESGRKILGEATLSLLAKTEKVRGRLVGNTLVTTVQSNLGLEAALKANGIAVARTDVGDKHIARLMLAEGYQVGGEESGHLVLAEFAVTGDGLFAATKIASILAESGKLASEVAGDYKAYPQLSEALRVAEKRPLSECERIAICIEELERSLGEEGRLLVRYSGTETKIRLLVEASSEELVARSMKLLVSAVAEDLEVL